MDNFNFNDMFNLQEKATDPVAREWLKDGKNRLLAELYIAELQARKGGKRKTYDTHGFEVNLMENLIALRDALWNLEYKPSRGTAHVVFRPVQREIFAAPYVDRVVHHEIVNSIIDYWEPRLHYGSCSCRVGKGTSYGIKLLQHHILSASENGKKNAYVIKLDISGYFMHIDREILYKRMLDGLDDQFAGKKDKRYRILKHAIHAIVFDDPTDGVTIQGSFEDWRGLPEDKSLFAQPEGRGMVIGNLTSQFCSNVYLDPLDKFIAEELGFKRYVRYVDDFVFVVTEDELPRAKRSIQVIANFLNGIGLTLNAKKTKVLPWQHGVPFLGEVIRGQLILPGDRAKKNFLESAEAVVAGVKDIDSIISYLGMLEHYNSKRAIAKIFKKVGWGYQF